jgi:hypothetical protein
VVNNNQQEQVKGTTEVVKTTKEDKTTTTEKEVTTEKESAKESEAITEVTQTTTKAPETTKKPISNSSSGSGSSNSTTKKPTPTTTKPATTKPAASTNISVLGNQRKGDMTRAGLYYTEDGKLTTYDKIAPGEWYWYYDANGDSLKYVMPQEIIDGKYEYDYCTYCGYSLANIQPNSNRTCPSCKSITDTLHGKFCEYCGKHRNDVYNETGSFVIVPASSTGGCDRSYRDFTCSHCGEFVQSDTCHTCK